MEKRDVAQVMLDILPDDRTWSKHYLLAGNNRRCLLGARLHIAGYKRLATCGNGYLVASLDEDEYTQLLARIVREQFPDRATEFTEPHAVVVAFNDDCRTRFADIRLVLEKAAVACSEG